jgi:hypothetical protein
MYFRCALPFEVVPGLVSGIHAVRKPPTSKVSCNGAACGRMLRIRLGIAGTSPAKTPRGPIPPVTGLFSATGQPWHKAGLIVVLVGSVFLEILVAAAWAQSPRVRPEEPTLAQPMRTGAQNERPTIESLSRETQKAIRACDDDAALQCVADELTKYAEALKQITQAQRQYSSPIPQTRRGRRPPRAHDPSSSPQ